MTAQTVDRERSRAGRWLARPDEEGWEHRYVTTVLVVDLAAGLVGALLGYLVRFGAGATHQEMTLYLSAVLVLPASWAACLLLSRAYEPRFHGVGSEEFRRVWTAGIGLLAATSTLSWALQLQLARGWVLAALPFTVLATLVLRYAARKRLHRLRARGACQHRVLVVGHPAAAGDLVRAVRSAYYHGWEVVAACVPDGERTDVLDELAVPVAGGLLGIVDAVRQNDCDVVAVVACHEIDGLALRRLGWELEATEADLVIAPGLIEVVGPRIAIRPVCGLPLLHVERPELVGVRRMAKGAVDRTVAALALVLLAPLLVTLAVLVRLDSRGPALFWQERVGRGGQTFRMLKFRSMVMDAEARRHELSKHGHAHNAVLFKLRADPRVTRAGRWMRRLSLDELPQLLNVLRGEMSLVGPRPPLPAEVATYGQDALRRLLVKPGLTGLWQINGRADLDWESSVRLDLRYVENWSFAFDLLILWKTAGAVLRGRGAY